MAQRTTIAIHPARAAQLRALAAHHGVTVVEMIERLTVQALHAAGMSDALEGLEIDRHPDDTVWFAAIGMPHLNLPFDKAREVADALDFVAERNGRKTIELHGGDRVDVERVGNGLTIATAWPNGMVGKQSMTPAMARDLAKQLRRAAA